MVSLKNRTWSLNSNQSARSFGSDCIAGPLQARGADVGAGSRVCNSQPEPYSNWGLNRDIRPDSVRGFYVDPFHHELISTLTVGLGLFPIYARQDHPCNESPR